MIDRLKCWLGCKKEPEVKVDEPEIKSKYITFESIEGQILSALKRLESDGLLPHENGYVLVQGFISLPVLAHVNQSTWMAERRIVGVVCSGNKSKQLYQFSIKALLPELEI